jgi:hypothetical protein
MAEVDGSRPGPEAVAEAESTSGRPEQQNNSKRHGERHCGERPGLLGELPNDQRGSQTVNPREPMAMMTAAWRSAISTPTGWA